MRDTRCHVSGNFVSWPVFFLRGVRPAACRVGGAPVPGPVTALLSVIFFLVSLFVYLFPLLPCFACVKSMNSRPVCLLGLSEHVATESGENCPSVSVGVDACHA